MLNIMTRCDTCDGHRLVIWSCAVKTRFHSTRESQSGDDVGLGLEGEGLPGLLHTGTAHLFTGHLHDVDPGLRSRCVRGLLHGGKHLRPGQHHVLGGAVAAAEDHVRQRASAGHHPGSGLSGVDALLGLFVDEFHPRSDFLFPPSFGFHLVRPLIPPLCQRMHLEILFKLLLLIIRVRLTNQQAGSSP
ncbi:uncharacterized protein LOC133933329 isoform X1 [Platichthys flesus]|uniref:uncharacterized protein LOC133933329 isoform X1 n=1 Tax=Platichthys flesus TaxID=8260 RepID=UPI002DBBB412|nr:uncharacterized protein LOC133933329 isoform X1 [Platichthys flesus]